RKPTECTPDKDVGDEMVLTGYSRRTDGARAAIRQNLCEPTWILICSDCGKRPCGSCMFGWKRATSLAELSFSVAFVWSISSCSQSNYGADNQTVCQRLTA